MNFSALLSAQVLCLVFLAILFLQSGLDKVFNYKGNLEWISGHFAKGALKRFSGLMMFMITVLETVAGACCAIGLVQLLMNGDTQTGLIGAQLSALSIVSLFFGQRIAQDYVGAATLTSYFIISIMTIYLLGV